MSKRWAKRRCGCLEHELASLWLEETRDSYRVQVDKVYKPKGAGNYLAKYFAKGFEVHKEMVDAGFTNRYSFSRNFPRLESMRLRGTDEDVWSRVERIDFPAGQDLRNELIQEVAHTRHTGVMQQMGEEYMLQEKKLASDKRITRKVVMN